MKILAAVCTPECMCAECWTRSNVGQKLQSGNRGKEGKIV